MTLAASAEQHTIRCGPQRATTAEVGGTVRACTLVDRPLPQGYRYDQRFPDSRGTPLIPWPHRLAKGRYRFRGLEHQLGLTQPAAGNGVHGPTRWANWSPQDLSDQHATLGYVLPPQPGYPFTPHRSATYALQPWGLTVTTTATNFGDTPCPYGHGHELSLIAGPGTLDECELTVDAARAVAFDEYTRPGHLACLPGSRLDYRNPHHLDVTTIDHTYSELARDSAVGSGSSSALPTGPPPGCGWTTTIDTWRSTPVPDQQTAPLGAVWVSPR